MAENFKAKIKELEEKKKVINARIKKIQAQESEKKRKQDTRKKILLGAWVLKQVNDGKWNKDRFLSEIDRYLTNKNDRELFGLPPLKNDSDSSDLNQVKNSHPPTSLPQQSEQVRQTP